MRKAERTVLVGIVVAVALAIRLWYVLTAVVQHPLRADAGQYAAYAKNLVDHGVFSLATTVPPPPDAFRSPGYPALLALCRAFAGEQSWLLVVAVVQAVLGAATVLLVYRIARAWLPFAAALGAALLTAFSPHLVVGSAYVLTECATTFCVALAAWAFVGADSRSRLALAALAAGAGVLCNEALVVLPFAFGFAAWRTGKGRAVAYVLVALLPLGVWSLRNQVQPLAKTGSERATASISHGSYPGMVFRDVRYLGFPYREDPEQPAFGASWAGLREVLGRRVAAEPLRYASWYLLEKPLWLWRWPLVQGNDVYVYEVANSPYETQPVLGATHGVMRCLHVPLMAAAAMAALVALLRPRTAPVPLRALAAAVVAATLAYLPVIPDPRYLQPVRPLLFVLAAAGIAAAFAWCQRRCRPVPAAVPSPS
ncbi:MAG: glycosyltransferase family 39 protein [Planctomycetes bacterium]|nr:glycosyltransferase family 39 protein [Planctomycetota bacterium]